MKNTKKRLDFLQKITLILCITVMTLMMNCVPVSAQAQQKMPYLIKVNRACNTITVYQSDKNGAYTDPVKAMVCSVGAKGTQTKLGTFQTKEKFRWKLLMGNVYGQYATRIVGGILFHSVYYYKNWNPATLAVREYNKLGTAASHGCVRLSVADAKWIYDNCAVGTTVVIYDDAKNPGPLGKPEAIKILTAVGWDPTDPNTSNPYSNKFPTISGVKNIVTDYGITVDLLKDVKAKSSLGADITSKITIEGAIDYHKPGDYKITYSVEDEMGRNVTKTATVTVKESPAAPEITGVSDKLVNASVMIDRTFALSGVGAVRGDEKLDTDQIQVQIDQTDEDNYEITYRIDLDHKSATAKAQVHVDGVAPEINGVTKEFWLEAGEIPSDGFLLKGVTITDNYSAKENIDIQIKISENPEGGFDITYQATDEAGNVTTETSIIHND